MSFRGERQPIPNEAEEQVPTTQEMVAKVQEVLSTRLTALITLRNVENPELDRNIDAHAVRRWATGEEEPSDIASERLRHTYNIINEMLEFEGMPTVRAWFLGMNPYLNDGNPALMIAVDPEEVHNAALHYVANG